MGVTHYAVLRSPDFPPRHCRGDHSGEYPKSGNKNCKKTRAL